MRPIIYAACLALAPAAAQAGTIAYLGAAGAPVCNSQEPLDDLLKSIDRNDSALQQRVIKGGSCIMLKENTQVEVIGRFKAYSGSGVRINFRTAGKVFELYTIDAGFRDKSTK